MVSLGIGANRAPSHDDAVHGDAAEHRRALAAVPVGGEDVLSDAAAAAVDDDVLRILRPNLHHVPVRLQLPVALAPVHPVLQHAPVPVDGVSEALLGVPGVVAPAPAAVKSAGGGLPPTRSALVVVANLATSVPLIATRAGVHASLRRVHALPRALNAVPRSTVGYRRVPVPAVGSLVHVIVPGSRQRGVDAFLQGPVRPPRGALPGGIAPRRRHVYVAVQKVYAVLARVSEVLVARMARERAVADHVVAGGRKLPDVNRPRRLVNRVRAVADAARGGVAAVGAVG